MNYYLYIKMNYIEFMIKVLSFFHKYIILINSSYFYDKYFKCLMIILLTLL